MQKYRIHRQTSRVDPKTGNPKKSARATLYGEIVALRQVLKTGNRKGWIAAILDVSAPITACGIPNIYLRLLEGIDINRVVKIFARALR